MTSVRWSQFYGRINRVKGIESFLNRLECGPSGIWPIPLPAAPAQVLPEPLNLLQLQLLSDSYAEFPMIPWLYFSLFWDILRASQGLTYKSSSPACSLTNTLVPFSSDNRINILRFITLPTQKEFFLIVECLWWQWREGPSLVAQGLRIHLPKQGTWVWSLGRFHRSWGS